MTIDFPRHSAPLDAAERAEFVPFLHELAAVSVAVIRPYYLHGTAVELKGDDSPVTAADRRAEEVMRLLILQRYPEHGILGEEFGVHRPDARYRWVLDPSHANALRDRFAACRSDSRRRPACRAGTTICLWTPCSGRAMRSPCTFR